MSCHTHGSTSVGLWVVACTMNGQWTWSIFCMCTMVSVNFRKSWTWSVLHITFKHNVKKKYKNASIKQKQKQKGSRR